MNRMHMQNGTSDTTLGMVGIPIASVGPDKIRLLIIDDHPIVRFGLTAL